MTGTTENFKTAILAGIPRDLPAPKPFDHSVNHAPKRKDILSVEEKNWPFKMRYVIFIRAITQR